MTSRIRKELNGFFKTGNWKWKWISTNLHMQQSAAADIASVYRVLLTACAAVDLDRNTEAASMTEVLWCDVELMQSACIVSRLFTLLIALLRVAQRRAPAAAADHVTCWPVSNWVRVLLHGTSSNGAQQRRAAQCQDWWRKCVLPPGKPGLYSDRWIERNRKRKEADATTDEQMNST